MKTILITGGARSGKSRFAHELAAKLSEAVLFVATAEAGDEEMKQRIEEHKRSRPKTWSTLEVTSHVGSHIQQRLSGAGVVVVDCITLLVNNIFNRFNDREDEHMYASLLEEELMSEIGELLECINQVNASFIIVTNEIGLGVVPADRVSRIYRDLLGKANQMLAERADEVYLMVAGVALPVKSVQP